MKKGEAYDLYYKGYPVDFNKIGEKMKFKVGDKVKTDFGVGKIVGTAPNRDWTVETLNGRSLWNEDQLEPVLSRKSIRRELKSLKADLRQLADEACYRDRAWGEQIDRMADRVGEMVEKV